MHAWMMRGFEHFADATRDGQLSAHAALALPILAAANSLLNRVFTSRRGGGCRVAPVAVPWCGWCAEPWPRYRCGRLCRVLCDLVVEPKLVRVRVTTRERCWMARSMRPSGTSLPTRRYV